MRHVRSSTRRHDPARTRRGYTLVELIVALGLFSVVMTLTAQAYLVMINANRRAQALATGINELSFVLETMTRDIRTGTQYDCGGGDCPLGSSTFSFRNTSGQAVTYSLSNGVLLKTQSGNTTPITDSAITITSLSFYAFGTSGVPDTEQARVAIVVGGEVVSDSGTKAPFLVETGATMRGSDL